ncbi:MAG: hypothetical protein HY332_08640 [Chloroflexi bacterium]|nr:hypothetical protein [Chloroflexota bacterium]
MAVQRADALDEARAQIQPLAVELMRFVRQTDPEAAFSLDPPIDGGIWLLRAYVMPPFDSDPDFHRELAEREVDLLIEHGVSIATIPLPRRAAAE